MIFKESSTLSNKNFLPFINHNNKNDNEYKGRNKLPLIELEAKTNDLVYNNLTLNTNYTKNYRYNTEDNNEHKNYKELNISKEQKTIESYNAHRKSRIVTNENISCTTRNPFIAKVVIENIIIKKDCIILLDEYLKKNNKECQYKISSEENKLIFHFDDEKTAFDFAKIIYNEKHKNSLFRYIVVHLKLLPNQVYLKKIKLNKPKKGLSLENIIKLYKGSSYIKREKEMPKVNGNLNFGLKSPFYNVLDKYKKLKSFKNFKTKKYFSRNIINVDNSGLVGYDGLPLKSYNKLKISVLDTHYNPFPNINCREDNRKKWVSPSNFICY